MTVLAQQQLLPLVQKYFGDLGPEAVMTMMGIIQAESSGNTTAHNAQDPYGGSYGLAQINGVHGYDPDALQDPEYNLMAARQVWDKQGPQAWSTYTNGSYLGGMPMTTDGFDLTPWDGLLPFVGGGGGGNSDDAEMDALVNSLLGEGGASGDFDPFTSMTGDQRVKLLGENGWTYVEGSGYGESALWRSRDGRTLPERMAINQTISAKTGAAASGFSLSPGQTRYGPNGEIIAQAPPSASASSGFTLSGGQTRYVPDGRGGFTAVQAPIENDPTAMIKLQQAQMDLAIKAQNLKFLQDKHAFEVSQDMRDAAAKTEEQIFRRQYDIRVLQNNIDQFNAKMAFDQQQANIKNERERQQQLQDLATDIGTLAQDPGDRARYASTVLANSGWGQDVAGDMRTNDSLMPLEALLRQRSDLMGGTPQVSVPPVSGINLGALPTANPAAQPGIDTTPGYDTGTGQPGIPYGGIALDPEEINAGAQWAPTPGFEQPAGTAGGINLAALLGPDGDLPMKSKGGMEDEAFIAGESGPEIVIPKADGKAVILNQEQAKVAGIDLSKLKKFADGGLFDGLIRDQDRGLATNFLTEATARAKSGTPWAGQAIPGPTFASSPGFDPIVAQLMASINAMETGVPAAAYLRNAALRRPAGVNEAPIRRSA